MCGALTSTTLAAELSEVVRYGSEINGVRVVLDIALPQQTPAQRLQTEQLLLSAVIPWLPAGESWKQRVFDKHKEMHEDILALRKEFPNNASAKHWYSDSIIETTWSTETLVCCHATNVRYTGGAHGNSDALALILDLKTNRVLSIDEVIEPQHQQAFSALLTARYKQQKRLPAEADLRDHGLEVDILPVRMPCITAAGISVIYPPYEVAPYAHGAITVSIARPDILPLLKFNPWAENKIQETP